MKSKVIFAESAIELGSKLNSFLSNNSSIIIKFINQSMNTSGLVYTIIYH